MLTIPAIEIAQGKHRLYLTAIRGGDLRNWMEPKSGSSPIKADIWDKGERPEGYQRPPDKDRIADIANFLLGRRGIDSPIMPQSIFLNLRSDKFTFKTTNDEGLRQGLLRIPDEAVPLFEVDGQHRLRGLVEAITREEEERREKRLPDYEVPVVITTNFPAPDEALQFVAINTMQVKVKPDLVLRVLWKHHHEKIRIAEVFLKTKSWKIKAVDIVDAINRDPHSPFYLMIAPPSTPGRLKRDKLTTEAQFVDSLEALAQHERIFEAGFVGNLWKAIAYTYLSNVQPDRRRDYLLFQRSGLYVFNKIAPILAYYTQSSEGGCGAQELSHTVEKVKEDFPLSFWRKEGRAKNFNYRGGYNQLADQIIRKLVGCDLVRTRRRLPKALTTSTARLTTLRLFREFDRENVKKLGTRSAGVYVLLNLARLKAYVGFSGSGEKKDLRSRILDHIDENYQVFNHEQERNSEAASLLERSAWHALRDSGWSMVNKKHPERRGYDACPVCNH